MITVAVEKGKTMSRYIDADALKKDLSENYVFYGFRQLLNDFYEALDSAPSIDIVRCGECKYSRKAKSRNSDLNCKWHHRNFKADDFCSYGEREGE